MIPPSRGDHAPFAASEEEIELPGASEEWSGRPKAPLPKGLTAKMLGKLSRMAIRSLSRD